MPSFDPTPVNYVIYDAAGAIQQFGVMKRSDFSLHAAGGKLLLLEGEGSDQTNYVDMSADPHELKARPALPVVVSKMEITADDTDAALISGLPDPCTVSIDGVDHDVTGGTLTLTSAMPATYHLTCKHWPYLDWDVGIEAVAQ